jgi:hypothetical protein
MTGVGPRDRAGPDRETFVSDWLRRLRGAIGLGLAWAVGWAPVGPAVGLVVGVTLAAPIGLGGSSWSTRPCSRSSAIAGGALFSTALRLSEGGRRFDELSPPRFTALGATGGLVLGGLVVGAGLWGIATTPTVAVGVVAASTMLGAESAAGTLAIARQADATGRVESGSGRAALSRRPPPTYLSGD